jgi:hypothetical protein
MGTLAICITLVMHHSYPQVYVQLHLNAVLNNTHNIAAVSLYISQKHSTLLFIAEFSITYYMIRLTAILSTYFHTGTAINKPVSNANMYIPPIDSLEMILGKEAFCHLICFLRYIRHLIFDATNSKVGCCIAGIF